MSTPVEVLRECPFCGQRDINVMTWFELHEHDDADDGWLCICTAAGGKPGCGAGTGWYRTSDEAIAAWNRRAVLDAQEKPTQPTNAAAHAQLTQRVEGWPEDASHENGNYDCVCCRCLGVFTGHKRRIYCKSCDLAIHTDAAASNVTAEPLAQDGSTWSMEQRLLARLDTEDSL